MDETTLNEQTRNGMPPLKQAVKMIALRGMVLFPGEVLHFDLARDKSMLALNKSLEDNADLFLVAQKHSSSGNPAPKDIYRIGCQGKIKRVIKLANDMMRVEIYGIKRMEIDTYTSITPYFEVTLKEFIERPSDQILLEAVRRRLDEQLEKFRHLDSKLPRETIAGLTAADSAKLLGVVGTYIVKDDAQKQRLLEIPDEYSRLEEVYAVLARECEILATEKRIAGRVRESIDKNQREYYLREQIKAIHGELGESDDELQEYRDRIREKNLPKEAEAKALKEISRMEKMSPTSPEAGVSRTYLDWVLDMPWNNFSEDNGDLAEARRILDEDHYGLEKVKDRIVEYLAVHRLTGSLRGPILCFVGPPGVGKTSVVASIARAAGRKLVSMSLGGVRDEAEIRGHRRTYIGALPGRIISGMKQADVINPVFLLDEIDKMSSDFRGDPASAMLEVLDPNQNNAFKDHYLDLAYDLSKVMFVCTANSTDSIPPPLLDRMEIIELSGYTYEEKLQIAKRYLLPKQLEANGLKPSNISIADSVIMKIISLYTRESGVRSLEREIAAVARKVAVKVVADGADLSKTYTVTEKDLTEYLGVEKYKDNLKNEQSEVGLATGLAWTSVGGVTLSIEVALIADGKGEIILTGSLGDVMKESCRTALSLVRSRAAKYAIDPDVFSKYDIHIHFPEGATPKDGPSAGITIATAILSALSGKKVNRDVAMTGEVTLRGKVLAIGGLKEKSLAAFRAGVKKLIVPSENKKDADELPAEVKDNIRILYADTVDDVFASALV